MEHSSWLRIKRFIAGYSSGVALVVAGHPFDTIKVRMQTQGSQGKFNGVVDCVRSTIQHEGVGGLYKGMLTPLLMTGFVNSALFGMQFNIVAEIVRHRTNDPAAKPTVAETMQAAVVSGGIISILVTPMEGIKGRLQVQYKPLYNGPVDCFKKVYATLGLRNGIYRGWTAVALCRMSNYSYFGSYALISSWFSDKQTDKPLPFSAAIMAGGLSGCCYWLSCYPLDVIKNRIQAAPDTKVPLYRNIVSAAKTIYKTEGLKGFTVGFTPCVLRDFLLMQVLS